jgi:glutamine synthetase
MFNNSEEVLKFIKDEDVKFVDIRFCDLPGVMQHFNVPAASVDADALTEGQMFDGSSIRGFQAIHESDTLVINHSIVDPFTGEPYSRDPRNIAAKAEAHLKTTGIADTVFFGAEAEFYIFDDVRFETNARESYYHIDSVEAAWNTGRAEDGGNRGYKTRYKGGYFPVPSTTSRTCATRWSSSWRRPACPWSARTTRSAPRASRRSTTGSTA